MPPTSRVHAAKRKGNSLCCRSRPPTAANVRSNPHPPSLHATWLPSAVSCRSAAAKQASIQSSIGEGAAVASRYLRALTLHIEQHQMHPELSTLVKSTEKSRDLFLRLYYVPLTMISELLPLHKLRRNLKAPGSLEPPAGRVFP